MWSENKDNVDQRSIFMLDLEARFKWIFFILGKKIAWGFFLGFFFKLNNKEKHKNNIE